MRKSDIEKNPNAPPKRRGKVLPAKASEGSKTGKLRRWTSDPRLPPAGTTLTRTIRSKTTGKEVTCTIKVLEGGILMDGVTYRSVTAAATAFVRTTGGGSPNTRRNGFDFFRLNAAKAEQKPTAVKAPAKRR